MVKREDGGGRPSFGLRGRHNHLGSHPPHAVASRQGDAQILAPATHPPVKNPGQLREGRQPELEAVGTVCDPGQTVATKQLMGRWFTSGEAERADSGAAWQLMAPRLRDVAAARACR